MRNKNGTAALRPRAAVAKRRGNASRMEELPPGTQVETVILAETGVPSGNPQLRKAPAQAPRDAEVLALLDAADAERARLFP